MQWNYRGIRLGIPDESCLVLSSFCLLLCCLLLVACCKSQLLDLAGLLSQYLFHDSMNGIVLAKNTNTGNVALDQRVNEERRGGRNKQTE